MESVTIENAVAFAVGLWVVYCLFKGMSHNL